MNEHLPATAIPLETVSSRIENILKVKAGHEQTQVAALKVKEKIEAGESIDSVKAEGIKVEVLAAVSRTDSARVSDVSIIRETFEMMPATEEKASVQELDLISGDVALIVLNKINSPENILQSRLDLVKSDAIRENAIRDFSSALLTFKENAKIEKNTRLINKTD